MANTKISQFQQNPSAYSTDQIVAYSPISGTDVIITAPTLFQNITLQANSIAVSNSISVNGSVGTAGQVLTSGDVTGNSYWTSNVTVNNANYLGGVAAASYLTTAGLSAYVNTSGNFSLAGNVTFNGNAIFGNTISANGTTGSAGQVLTSSDGSGNAYWTSNVTVNNANYLNAVPASAYVNTSGNFTLAGNITHSGNAIFGNTISANGSVGTVGQVLTSPGAGANAYWTSNVTVNNANYLNAVPASSYVNTSGNFTLAGNTIFSANVTVSGANTSIGGTNTNITSNTVIAANLTVTGTLTTPNTFALGSATKASNGYCFLPNGVIINWGFANGSSTAGTITFTQPFTSNCYGLSLTANGVGGNGAYYTALSNTAATIRTALTTNLSISYIAIGY